MKAVVWFELNGVDYIAEVEAVIVEGERATPDYPGSPSYVELDFVEHIFVNDMEGKEVKATDEMINIIADTLDFHHLQDN